jgi:hypothetical protein
VPELSNVPIPTPAAPSRSADPKDTPVVGQKATRPEVALQAKAPAMGGITSAVTPPKIKPIVWPMAASNSFSACALEGMTATETNTAIFPNIRVRGQLVFIRKELKVASLACPAKCFQSGGCGRRVDWGGAASRLCAKTKTATASTSRRQSGSIGFRRFAESSFPPDRYPREDFVDGPRIRIERLSVNGAVRRARRAAYASAPDVVVDAPGGDTGTVTWCSARSEKFCWDFDRGTYDNGWEHVETLGTVTQSSDAASPSRAMASHADMRSTSPMDFYGHRWCSSARCASLSMAFPPSGITKRVTLHAATRAGGHDEAGREALLKYILRPAVAQERVTRGPDGLVRITLKKPFSDVTVAVDMDPLSLLSRLAESLPAPRLSPFGDHEARHTVRYAGVLASASKLRARLAPKPVLASENPLDVPESPRRGAYRPWAELLKRTFGFDVLTCPCCSGRMKLLALVTDPTSVARYLRGIGEPTDVPKRTPARGPPYWASRVLRRGAASVEAAE